MASKFEKVLEAIINEDHKSAEAMFHQIVVERSRKIYEDLESMHEDDDAGDFADEVDHEETNSDMHEADFGDDDREDHVSDEDFDGDEVGGDQADDLLDDTISDDDEFSQDHEDAFDEKAPEETEDRIVDLEDQMDDLQAEFDRLVNGGDEESDDEDFGGDDESEDENDEFDSGNSEDADEFEDEDEDESDDEDEDEDEDDDEVVREYVEKVAKPSNSETSGTNSKSIVAGKNDMGGSAKNLVQGGESKGRPTPTSKPISSEKWANEAGGRGDKLKPAPKAKRTGEESGTNKKPVIK